MGSRSEVEHLCSLVARRGIPCRIAGSSAPGDGARRYELLLGQQRQRTFLGAGHAALYLEGVLDGLDAVEDAAEDAARAREVEG